MQEWLTPKQAGLIIGVSPSTVRGYIEDGSLIAKRINSRGDRRISHDSIQAYLGNTNEGIIREAIYSRVSGRGDQLSSLEAQEEELLQAATGSVVVNIKEVGSGLNDKRRGLNKLINAARQNKIDRVTVVHKDRLTRFGFTLLVQLFESYEVTVQVLHEEVESQEEELVQDFMSLLASFSGRLYGQRSAAARQRLLQKAGGS